MFLQYNRGMAMPAVVWDALKAYLRGLFIRPISSIKTNIKEWENLVLSEARKADKTYITNPTEESEHSWLEAQALYQQISLMVAENKRFLYNSDTLMKGKIQVIY